MNLPKRMLRVENKYVKFKVKHTYINKDKTTNSDISSRYA